MRREETIDEALWMMVRAMEVPTMVLFEAGRPYLARFRIADPAAASCMAAVGVSRVPTERPFRTYLHYFLGSDDAGLFHDHPWDESQSLILTGMYSEERLVPDGIERATFAAGDVNVIRRGEMHRIDLLSAGCWTLFTAGQEHGGSWGFVRRGGGERIPWRERNERDKPDQPPVRTVSDDPRIAAWRHEAFRK